MDSKHVFLAVAMSHLTEADTHRLEAEVNVVRTTCADLGVSLTDPTRLVSIKPSLTAPQPGVIYRHLSEELPRIDAMIVHCGVESTAVGYEAAAASREGLPLIILTRDGRVPTVLMQSTSEPRFDVSFDSLEALARGLRGAIPLALKIESLRDQLPDPAHDELFEVVQFVHDGLIKRVAQDPHLLYELPSRKFEELMAELLTRAGWEVSLTAASRDGGYDLFGVTRDAPVGTETRWVIECKRFAPHRKVGVDVVRSLYGIAPVISHGANVMLATTSWFTQGVREFKASRYDLELRDHDDLVRWLRNQRGTHGTNLEGP